MSRTQKRPYSKSKRFDNTCRNHGACSHCRNNRTYADRKRRGMADLKLREAGYV